MTEIKVPSQFACAFEFTIEQAIDRHACLQSVIDDAVSNKERLQRDGYILLPANPLPHLKDSYQVKDIWLWEQEGMWSNRDMALGIIYKAGWSFLAEKS